MKNFTKISNYYNKLINPDKYVGKNKIVTVRSSLELKYIIFLDKNDRVLEWSSEDRIFNYKDLTGKNHRYYIDFWLKYINNDNIVAEKFVEIKPYYQTIPPKATYSRYAKAQWIQNNLKWQAVKDYCELNENVKFEIVTEKQL